jgi:protein TonB
MRTPLTVLLLLAGAAAQTQPQPVPQGQQQPPLSQACTAEDVKQEYKGNVVLQLEVDTSGKPHNVTVVKKLRTDLDKAAVDAVKGWRMKPAMKDGKPVAVKINVEVGFDCSKVSAASLSK